MYALWSQRQERERQERERQERIREQEIQRQQLEQQRIEQLRAEQMRASQAEQQAKRLAAMAQQEQAAAQQQAAAPSAPGTPGAAAPGGPTPAPYGTPAPSAPDADVTETLNKFRDELRDKSDYSLAVGRGEVVRVRVPNHRPGTSRLVWQFCTEYYDIGFGLDYEVATADGSEPTVETLTAVERMNAHEALMTGGHVNPGKTHASAVWLGCAFRAPCSMPRAGTMNLFLSLAFFLTRVAQNCLPFVNSPGKLAARVR